MLSALMEILACPVDHGELRLTISEQVGEDIVAGILECCVCGETYPIEASIPNLLPQELRQ